LRLSVAPAARENDDRVTALESVCGRFRHGGKVESLDVGIDRRHLSSAHYHLLAQDLLVTRDDVMPDRESSSSTRFREQLREAPSRGDDCLARKAAEAEHEARSRLRLLVHGMDGPDSDSVAPGRRFDRRVRSTMSKVGDEMHPLIGCVDHDMVLCSPGQLGDQRIALTPILEPSSPQMRREVPVTHELGDHRLFEARRLPIDQISCTDEGTTQ